MMMIKVKNFLLNFDGIWIEFWDIQLFNFFVMSQMEKQFVDVPMN